MLITEEKNLFFYLVIYHEPLSYEQSPTPSIEGTMYLTFLSNSFSLA